MEKSKIFENVEIKNFISIVTVLILVGVNVYGCICGKFDDIFEFDKQIIMMVFSFFLGTKIAKKDTDEATVVSFTEPETAIVADEVEHNE